MAGDADLGDLYDDPRHRQLFMFSIALAHGDEGMQRAIELIVGRYLGSGVEEHLLNALELALFWGRPREVLRRVEAKIAAGPISAPLRRRLAGTRVALRLGPELAALITGLGAGLLAHRTGDQTELQLGRLQVVQELGLVTWLPGGLAGPEQNGQSLMAGLQRPALVITSVGELFGRPFVGMLELGMRLRELAEARPDPGGHFVEGGSIDGPQGLLQLCSGWLGALSGPPPPGPGQTAWAQQLLERAGAVTGEAGQLRPRVNALVVQNKAAQALAVLSRHAEAPNAKLLLLQLQAARLLNATLANDRGGIEAALRQTMPLVRELERTAPGDFGVQLNAAWLCARFLGDLEGALAHYQKAIELCPLHPDAIRGRGGCRNELGRPGGQQDLALAARLLGQ